VSEPANISRDPLPALSIGIVCFNSSELELRKLIASILQAVEHLKQPFSEVTLPIYLIENSENQDLILSVMTDYEEQASQLNVEFRLLHGHGNVGYGRAHNLALPKLESDLHLMLNPDVVLEKECLESGITFMRDNPGVCVSSPHAEYENGGKQYLCKRYPSVLTFIVRGFLPPFLRTLFGKRLAAFEMHELSEDEPCTDIPIVSGCFMLCRTDALNTVGNFDEKYFLYFEDFDLCVRLGEIGKIAYLPTMKIIHGGGHAAKKGLDHLQMFAKSGIRFFSTHGWRFFRQAR